MKGVRNIFVVDDDNTQAMMLQDYLSKYSTFTVHIYNSGEECLSHMDLKPEIIFLDYYFDKVPNSTMNVISILK